MGRIRRRNKPIAFSAAILPALAMIVWAQLVFGSVRLEAEEPRPVLIVPASATPVHVAVDLPDAVKTEKASAWQLVEIDAPGIPVPLQLATAIAADGSGDGQARRLLASIPPREAAKDSRRFRLEPAEAAAAGNPTPFQLEDVDDKSLKLLEAGKPVAVYNHGVITCERVPKKNHRRRRGCYVHPVWGLSGEVLTDDFPPDHYHHHGIFWTWPHIGIEGQEYNLWMGNNIQDRFVRWIARETGPVAAVLAVENGWFVGEKKVMIERVWLRCYRASADDRALDIEFAWVPVDKPITLWGAGGKSYGGLTMRFAPPSRKDPNTVITVPSGRTDHDLPDTRLAWADFTTRFTGAAGPSGAAVFVSPNHPDYPPTWLTRHYGPLCVGWPGVKPKTFPPGKPIRLNYRIWIHKTAVETGQLARAYASYTAATNVKWQE